VVRPEHRHDLGIVAAQFDPTVDRLGEILVDRIEEEFHSFQVL